MNNEQLPAILLILGFVSVLVASVVGPPRLYQEPDVNRQLELIEEHQGTWIISNVFFGLAGVVTAVGLAASSYRALYGPDLLFPETAEALAALEEDGRPVWVLFTFPRDMRIRYGDLFDYIEAHYERQAVFPGTVGDGAIYVMKTKAND